MVTFRTHLGSEGKQGRKVYIRCIYQRRAKDFPTAMYLQRGEYTAGGKIKNAQVAQRCEELINEFRKRVFSLGVENCRLSPDDLFKAIANERPQVLSFTAYCNEWLSKSKRRGTDNYRVAVRAFHRFMGIDDIPVSLVTCDTLERFSESLASHARARTLYISAVVKIFNDMREDTYNEIRDEYEIKHSLRRFKCPKQNFAILKRALTLEQVRAIFSLTFSQCSTEKAVKNLDKEGEEKVKNIDKRGAVSRAGLAADCWVLSFCLMGINSVDLYELRANQFDGQFITYNRHKTTERRNDSARMVVAVPPLLLPLFEKYKGEGGSLFRFSQRYGDYKAFNRALNIGLKEVGNALGIDRLTFYTARHSFATLAANVAGVDKYMISEMLCHVDAGTRTTDIYISKDWTRVHDAARRVLAVVLGGAS